MGDANQDHISRYVMKAFGRSTAAARTPRKKPDGRHSVTTARIVLSVQYDGRFAYIPLSPVDIRADSAEWYGYQDSIPCNAAPSMLDVIVQAHELIYGDAFNRTTCHALLDVDEDGILRQIMGLPGIYTCFVINGQYSYDVESDYDTMGFLGLSYAETPVYDLDVVEIFSFPQSKGLDYYTYFLSYDGSWVRSLDVLAGEAITIQHEGFLFAVGGPYLHEDRIQKHMVAPVKGSRISIVNTSTFAFEPVEGAVTDEDGLVTFCLEEPGHYYLTAHGGMVKAYGRNMPHRNLSLPWLPVIVR